MNVDKMNETLHANLESIKHLARAALKTHRETVAATSATD